MYNELTSEMKDRRIVNFTIGRETVKSVAQTTNILRSNFTEYFFKTKEVLKQNGADHESHV
jgi:hypothetical protein